MLDNDLLEKRLSKWIGYGNLQSDFWMLGMEEGGEVNRKMINVRLSLPEVGDWHHAMEKMAEAGGIENKWIRAHPSLQPTYYKIIRIFLIATGRDSPNLKEKARKFQRDQFGRKGGDHLVAELMPLHNHNQSHWIYNRFSNRPDLSSRESYMRKWLGRRIKLFRELIEEYDPKVVLAYGKGYWDHFKLLGERKFKEILDGFAQTDGRIVLIPHPTAKGLKNSDFDEVGNWIKENIYSSRLL